MFKMRRWNRILILAVTAAFSVGLIHDLGSINAEERSEQTEAATESEISATEIKEGDDLKTEALDTSVSEPETSHNKTTTPPPEKRRRQKSKKLVNGQTFLDVSKGDIVITATGATGGGLEEDESELNPEGYRIIGKTKDYNVTVNSGVTTNLTLDNVDITIGQTTNTKLDCINVSHANVTMLLIGKNHLMCYAGTTTDGASHDQLGNALTKDGMDGQLTIRCQKAGEKGHKCNDECGCFMRREVEIYTMQVL